MNKHEMMYDLCLLEVLLAYQHTDTLIKEEVKRNMQDIRARLESVYGPAGTAVSSS
jgi:hypothetical protein